MAIDSVFSNRYSVLSFFRFTPDWVLRKDKMKDIVDPLTTIEMVANTLSIEL